MCIWRNITAIWRAVLPSSSQDAVRLWLKLPICARTSSRLPLLHAKLNITTFVRANNSLKLCCRPTAGINCPWPDFSANNLMTSWCSFWAAWSKAVRPPMSWRDGSAPNSSIRSFTKAVLPISLARWRGVLKSKFTWSTEHLYWVTSILNTSVWPPRAA